MIIHEVYRDSPCEYDKKYIIANLPVSMPATYPQSEFVRDLLIGKISISGNNSEMCSIVYKRICSSYFERVAREVDWADVFAEYRGSKLRDEELSAMDYMFEDKTEFPLISFSYVPGSPFSVRPPSMLLTRTAIRNSPPFCVFEYDLCSFLREIVSEYRNRKY